MALIPRDHIADNNRLSVRESRPFAASAEVRMSAPHERLTALQIWAWTLANFSFQVPDGRAYLRYAQSLYEEDTHARILSLFAALDSQNAEIDARMWSHAQRGPQPAPRVEGAA